MTAVSSRSARDALAAYRDLVDPALRAAVGTLPESMRHIAGYHFGWWNEHGAPSETGGGKALRPALVLLSADAMGWRPGEPDSRPAVPAAVAVELIHNFSLVHDDVMDGDLTRRHRPTVWSVFGRNQAILAGDAMEALAFRVLAASGHPAAQEGVQMLSAAVVSLLDGQSSDLSFEERTGVDLPECMGMAGAKTGALLGCACAIGALFGGGRADQISRLRAFGELVGVAFQHVDDLLGIWGDPAVTGKPVHSDLRNRKKSLPVVSALTSGTAAGEELAQLYRLPQPLSDEDAAYAAKLIEKAGGRDWSQAQATDLLERALDQLRAAGPAEYAAGELTTLAKLAVNRRA